MCLTPIKILNRRNDFDARFDSKYLYVSCGHCWQCVQSRQYDYEKRAVSEFKSYLDNNGSVWNYTLTYNEANVPRYFGVNVLYRRDIQLFKKRLKKSFGEKSDKVDILYAGEYGHEHNRPHWHILIFCKFPFDAYLMYQKVKRAWSKMSLRYKGCDSWFSLGYVGLPSKWLEGRLLPFLPENALLDNVHAIRYTVKYIFKSYNFYQSLKVQFTKVLQDKYDFNDFEVDHFLFPDDDRFKFPDKELNLSTICRYFSSCYRSFNNFGMAQLNYLDDNYEFDSGIFDDKSGKSDTLTYSISNYLKDKLFHIRCVDNGKVLSSRYTYYWLDFQQKMSKKFLQKKLNNYICNKELKLFPSNINDKGFVYVKDILSYITDYVGCSLTDYLLYLGSYYNKPYLTKLDVKDIPLYLQSRQLDTYDFVGYEIDVIDGLITDVLPYQYYIEQNIAYSSYLYNVDKYNERQKLLALEYQKINRYYMPKYLDTLPFDKFINLKSISVEDEKKNF